MKIYVGLVEERGEEREREEEESLTRHDERGQEVGSCHFVSGGIWDGRNSGKKE